MPHPDTWLEVRPEGLYCVPGDFFIDPIRPVPRAIVTHAHSDHARPGHDAVLATPETVALMHIRMGEGAFRTSQALPYREPLTIGGVQIRLEPAGHVLGSAQIVLDWRGSRIVASGDYKRQPDPTCRPFVPIPCDVFITEATFALPVFRHPPAHEEIARLLASLALFPDRTHVVGAYALGKTQRVIALLREAGYDRPIYLHGANTNLCQAYESLGIPLGDLPQATQKSKADLAGAIVMAPPSAITDRWSRRLADPVVCFASGWMRVRQRARSRGVELPLVISDHADWDALHQTIDDVAAPEIWITHGREEALIHEATKRGLTARPLRLLGYEEDDLTPSSLLPLPPGEDPSLPPLPPGEDPSLLPLPPGEGRGEGT